MLDGTTRKIISVTSRTSASAYFLCHLTLLLSLFQKYRTEISSNNEEKILETMTREEWEETKLIFKTKVHNTIERIIYLNKSETYIK